MKKILLILALLLAACSNNLPILATSGPSNVPSQYSTIQKCVDSSTVCNVAAGTYSGTIKINKSNVTLQAVGKVRINGAIMIYGTGNTVRGFTISGKNAKAGIRLYGTGNTAEGNIIYDTLEDGIWFWGDDHQIISNYVGYDPDDNKIYAIHDDHGWPEYDNHVDCYMVMSWDGGSSDGVVFDGNVCIHNRDRGSNQGAMINGNITNLTFKNNTFVFYDGADGGYSPAFALFEGNGFTLENNYVCNTTGKGESVSWLQRGISNVSMSGNRWAGYNQLYKGGVIPSIDSTNPNVKESLPCDWVSDVPVTPTRTPTRTPIPATITPSLTRTSTASLAPTQTATMTPTPSKTPTITPRATKTPTSTFTPAQDLCVRVTWKIGLNLRETASMKNLGRMGFLYQDATFHPLEVKTVDGEGTFAKYGDPGWVAMWLVPTERYPNGRTYAVYSPCK